MTGWNETTLALWDARGKTSHWSFGTLSHVKPNVLCCIVNCTDSDTNCCESSHMHPYNRGRTCATYAKGPLPNASLATISGKTANSSWTLSCGWYELENTWKPLLLTKQPIEKGQLEVKTCRCKKSGLKCSTRSCTCVNNKLCCADACGCFRNSWCQNPYN